jgi:HEAT repeat protein
MAGEHDLELSLAAARTLGALRSVDGLPLLLGILEGLGTDWSFPHARATLSTALDGVFADPLSPSAVTRQWKGLSPRAQELLAESLLSSSAPAAAEFLLTRLGESPPLDLRILSKVGEPFQREPWRIEALDISGLLRALGSSEAGVRAQAATVIGKLRREDALEELLGHLRDGDMRVQRAVVTTLRAWSGNAGASSPEEWQAWAAQETRWHAESLPELLTAIAPDQPPEAVMAAATELARSPIHRREAVRELVKLLPHASPELGREILRLLVQLQGREAVPGLVDELASSSAGLESDCWKALRALTGADLGADPADWRAWLGL